MDNRWLSLALGASLLACGTPSLPHGGVDDADDSRTDDDDDDADEDEDEDEGAARTAMGGLDAGRSIDAGRRDASVNKRDAGSGMVTCAPDGAVIEPPHAPSDEAPSVGTPCGSDDDCGGGDLRCLTTVMLPFGGTSLTFPGGYCTKTCSEDDACGPGAGCPLKMAAQFAADLSTCMAHCASADDCRDGYSCSAVPAFGGQAPADPQKSCLPPSPFGAGGLPIP